MTEAATRAMEGPLSSSHLTNRSESRMNQAGGQNSAKLAEILAQADAGIFEEWVREQLSALNSRAASLIREAELREQSKELLTGLFEAAQTGSLANINRPGWTNLR